MGARKYFSLKINTGQILTKNFTFGDLILSKNWVRGDNLGRILGIIRYNLKYAESYETSKMFR